MKTPDDWKLEGPDLDILKALAGRVREIAEDPVQEERRTLWKRHNALRGERPMLLLEHFGIKDELGIESTLECRENWARDVELSLRRTVYQHENVGDDLVVEPYFNVAWDISVGDFGVTTVYEHGDNEGRLASYHWDPPIRDLSADFAKLRHREFAVDRERTLARKAFLESVFGSVLPVRIRGNWWWTMGLTWEAIKLVGLEQLMLLMYDDPEGLHRLMAFLRDDHVALVEWCEREGLLTLNNENDYIGSGSAGYTDELPQTDWSDGDPVRPKDQWVLSESQETVGVSPELFEEFVFPYQLDLASRFGLVYYGCCEPVHSRWDVVKKFPNLRKVSVSPWCDEEFMAEALAGGCVYCRKPNPALISTERFDEEAVRADIRGTLDVTGGRNVEIVMKDVHTVSGRPERLGRWVEIAREEIERTTR